MVTQYGTFFEFLLCLFLVSLFGFIKSTSSKDNLMDFQKDWSIPTLPKNFRYILRFGLYAIRGRGIFLSAATFNDSKFMMDADLEKLLQNDGTFI